MRSLLSDLRHSAVKQPALALFAALALSVPASGTAHAAEPVAVPASDRLAALADELAAILNSPAIILGTAEDVPQAKATELRILRGRADMLELEEDYPGILAEMVDALMPITTRSQAQRLPQLQQRQSALYQRTFTAEELTFLLDFYRSPTGKKMIALVVANMQTANMERSMMESDEFRVSNEALSADMQDTVRKVVPKIDASDEAALRLLVASSAAPKMRAMTEETQRNALDWYAEYAPGEEEEIDALIEALIARREKDKK